MNKKLLLVVVSFFFFLSLPFLCSGEQLTVLHTNDTHSHLFSFGPHNGYGGIARMSTLIKEMKEGGGNVLTLNSGDVFVGTFAFNKYLGYVELKIMEDLYDAWCLGNHEFDLGVDTLAAILGGDVAGGSPISLPTLCANIDLTQLEENHPLKAFVKPYMVLDVGTIKVGLIGVVTTDPYNYSEEVNAVLQDPYQAAGEAAYALRYSKGCDVVICLSHLGKTADEIGLSQVQGIDIIVGGHSHDAILEPEIVNGKIIVQAGEFGKYLGELKVDIENGQVNLVKYKLHQIRKRVKKDPALVPMLKNLKYGICSDPRFGPVYTERIATAKENLEERWKEGSARRDTALGNLVTDAIRASVENSGLFPRGGYPLIAFEANGYIAHRIYKGKVVGNDVMRAVPYGYDPESGLGFKMKVVLLAGQQILAGLEYSVSIAEYTDDLSMQVSGLTFKYDSSKPPVSIEELLEGKLSRLDPASVKIQGDPINPQGLYWVALNEQLLKFLLSLNLLPFQVIDTGLFEYNIVRDFMRKLEQLNYTSEGRIIDVALKSE